MQQSRYTWEVVRLGAEGVRTCSERHSLNRGGEYLLATFPVDHVAPGDVVLRNMHMLDMQRPHAIKTV